jgi:hypothetical protein
MHVQSRAQMPFNCRQGGSGLPPLVNVFELENGEEAGSLFSSSARVGPSWTLRSHWFSCALAVGLAEGHRAGDLPLALAVGRLIVP